MAYYSGDWSGYTIGYTDDITILLPGKFEGTLNELVQSALYLTESSAEKG